jgi:serine protease Do
MTTAFAESLGMVAPYGAIFARPTPGSPAAKAGIEAYDVITTINGVPLQSARDFAKIISSLAPGTVVYLTTWRSRQMIEVSLVLGGVKCSRRSSSTS